MGVFLYSMALDEETARQEASSMSLEQIRGYKISYPVAYDVESKYLLDNGKTPQELANQTRCFLQSHRGCRIPSILYGNNQWLTNYVDVSQVPYDIWYALLERPVNSRTGRSGSLPRRFRGRHHW